MLEIIRKSLKSCSNCCGDCGGGGHWNQVCTPKEFTNFELKPEISEELKIAEAKINMYRTLCKIVSNFDKIEICEKCSNGNHNTPKCYIGGKENCKFELLDEDCLKP